MRNVTQLCEASYPLIVGVVVQLNAEIDCVLRVLVVRVYVPVVHVQREHVVVVHEVPFVAVS